MMNHIFPQEKINKNSVEECRKIVEESIESTYLNHIRNQHRKHGQRKT